MPKISAGIIIGIDINKTKALESFWVNVNIGLRSANTLINTMGQKDYTSKHRR